MKRCCHGGCSQGRTCPLRTVRIPTKRSILSRAGDVLDRYPLLPLAVVLVALFFINS